jgi:hypothetical protein
MRASLLAMATTTTFLCALASSGSSHAPIGARSRLICSTAAHALPHLLMPNSFALPPVEY